MRQWFVLNTLTSHEQRVERLIKATASEQTVDLSQYIGQTLVPTERVVTQRKDGRKVTQTRKLFPGYVFIECDLYLDKRRKVLNKELWEFLNLLDGVIGFLGAERNLRGEMVRPPIPLPEKEVEDIRSMMNPEAHTNRPKVTYEPGETVSIIEGPFKGNTGAIQSVDPEHGRLTVSVSIFGGDTPVDLEYWQVERYVPPKEGEK